MAICSRFPAQLIPASEFNAEIVPERLL